MYNNYKAHIYKILFQRKVWCRFVCSNCG